MTKFSEFISKSLVLFSVVSPVAQASLAYWVAGSEHPDTVILVHGFNSSNATWKGVVPALSKHYRVVVYDQPGHGLSKAAGSDFSPRYMAERLNELMFELKIQSAHIVGHSMGGRTAMAFAFRYPEKVKSVLVEDMSAMPIPASLPELKKARERFEAVKGGVPDTFENAEAAAKVLAAFYTREESLWILSALQPLPDGRVRLGNRPEVTSLYLHQGLVQDMTTELKGIRAPFRFFAADPATGTAVLQGEAIEHIEAARPDVTVRVFPGATHMIHALPGFSTELLEFLRKP